MLFAPVAKPALGRGLGNLMKEAKSPPPPSENAPKPANLSPGMATLLQGGNGATEKAEAKAPADSSPDMRRRRRLIRGSLFFTDALLAALGARLVARSGGHPGFAGVALCILAFLAGAWLTCLALCGRRANCELMAAARSASTSAGSDVVVLVAHAPGLSVSIISLITQAQSTVCLRWPETKTSR